MNKLLIIINKKGFLMIVIINLLQKKCMMKTIKKGEPIPVNQFSDCVIAIGFEPMTVWLETRCSIQLSYATFLLRRDRDSNPGDVYTSTD